MSELILHPEDNSSVTMTIRISKKLKDQYEELAEKTGYSRNALITKAMKFAEENWKVETREE